MADKQVRRWKKNNFFISLIKHITCDNVRHYSQEDLDISGKKGKKETE